MSVISAMRTWLLTCPLLTGYRLNVDVLPPEGLEFDLIENPVQPVLRTYLDGTKVKQKALSLTGVQDYSPDLLNQISASGFWEALADWVETQNDAGNLPELDEGRTATDVAVTTAPYQYSTTAATARYQLQFLLTYEQECKETE